MEITRLFWVFDVEMYTFIPAKRPFVPLLSTVLLTPRKIAVNFSFLAILLP
jgi:hypothetical protein